MFLTHGANLSMTSAFRQALTYAYDFEWQNKALFLRTISKTTKLFLKIVIWQRQVVLQTMKWPY